MVQSSDADTAPLIEQMETKSGPTQTVAHHKAILKPYRSTRPISGNVVRPLSSCSSLGAQIFLDARIEVLANEFLHCQALLDGRHAPFLGRCKDDVDLKARVSDERNEACVIS